MSRTLHCPVHHGAVADCRDDSDLTDTLRALALRIPVRITPPADLDPCQACADTPDWARLDAAVVVCHRAPSEALPDGWVYREPACPVHAEQVAVWEIRRGCPVWVEVPAGAAAVTA